jgi:hypothetical protein
MNAAHAAQQQKTQQIGTAITAMQLITMIAMTQPAKSEESDSHQELHDVKE